MWVMEFQIKILWKRMADFLSIFSQICRGLKSMEKRMDVLHCLKKETIWYYLSSRCTFGRKIELYVKSEWGFRLYMSPYKSNFKGVMILINNTFEHEIGRIKKNDPNGNFIIVELTILGKKSIISKFVWSKWWQTTILQCYTTAWFGIW